MDARREKSVKKISKEKHVEVRRADEIACDYETHGILPLIPNPINPLLRTVKDVAKILRTSHRMADHEIAAVLESALAKYERETQ